MADELPEPKSRKESYLAKAAGMDVTIPEKPESREEQYLNAIAEGGGGGGGSYTAGDGIDITNDTISVDTDTIQEKLTAGTGIDITDNTISATGGGGPTVVQTTGNSTTDVMSQKAAFGMIVADTSSTIPYDRIQIGGASKSDSVAIGRNSLANDYSVSVGKGAGLGSNSSAAYNTDIGYSAGTNKGSTVSYSVSLGAHSKATRAGEVNIGTSTTTHGYNSTSYRVLGGVHDGQDAHDATTVGQVNTRLGGLTLLPITQTAYDALATKDANTLYVITGA